jgi:hypothetical protein
LDDVHAYPEEPACVPPAADPSPAAPPGALAPACEGAGALEVSPEGWAPVEELADSPDGGRASSDGGVDVCAEVVDVPGAAAGASLLVAEVADCVP